MSFNNREIASFIWLIVVFVIFVIAKREIRQSLWCVAKSFLKRQILIPILAMICYILFIVWGLAAIGFWDISALKETVFWVLGVAFIMLVNANKLEEKKGFFRNVILNNLALIAVLEFISNTYTFDLWIEVLLVPFITFIVIVKTIAETRMKTLSNYRTVNNVCEYLLILIGVVFIGFAIYRILENPTEFTTMRSLRDFSLPIILSILYLPFIYIWALFIAYEKLFFRIDINNNDRKLANYLKKLVLIKFHIRLWCFLKWSDNTSSLHVRNREDAKMLLND